MTMIGIIVLGGALAAFAALFSLIAVEFLYDRRRARISKARSAIEKDPK